MAERISVERTITEEILGTGEIPLGPAEQRRLELTDHSGAVPLIADGEELPVSWTAGRRRLSGEALLEYLQDTARVGDLLRLERRAGGGIELVVQAPLNAFSMTAWPVSAAVLPTATRADPAERSEPRRRARRISRGDRYRLRQHDEYAWHGQVGFLRAAQSQLLHALRTRGWDPADSVELRLEGERLATLDQFDELLALDAAHIEHMPHQEAAARTVLTRMSGRAVLADEVGLGKTVEAGLILKELLLRGLAERVLIACPAPLRDQWRDELREKFDEEFVVVASGQDAEAFDNRRMIMTLHLLLRNADRLKEPFDLVIVDEAHRLATQGARRTREVIGKLVAQASRALFLTATPVQNDLLELYRLVELLRPGTFRSERDFQRRFIDYGDPRRPVNPSELRKLISSVVVRTTRQQAGVDRVRRMPPQDQGVNLTAPERQLYDLLLETLRHRMTAPGDTMRRRQLALRLTASPQAVSRSALRMAERHPDPSIRRTLTEIGHLAGDIRHTAREQAALGVLRPWLTEHGRVLVFTQHTDTLQGLLRLLDAEGISAVPFHGGMSHAARADSVASFRAGKAAVLVSTDAGAEGQNLQVSNCVLNFDLPWNPMRVEQRIGRVHRLTQTRDVYIANLFARNTLDESVYRLLHDKLAMFELLFGQVVTVLGELDGNQEASMESRVLDALYEKSDATMQNRLDELGRQLEQARSRAMQMMSADNGLSQWLAQRHEEREARAAQQQARELLPQPLDRPRRRQKDLERFVCRFLANAGARLEQPSEGFTIATLSDELSAALDGREQLYLAFTNAALDAHPEAELCVVGSDVFDELLSALRVRGDLTGSVAHVPTVHRAPTIPHVPQIQLVERHLEPTDDWAGRATYRVQDGATTGNQRLVTIDVGRPLRLDGERITLPDGAPLPGHLTEASVLETVEADAGAYLGRELAQIQQAEQQSRSEAHEQLIQNLKQQLLEVESQIYRRLGNASQEQADRRAQLARALETAERATMVDDHAELRAELLTLELHGSDRLEVVERWRHDIGVTGTIRYEWTGAPVPQTLTCEATGQPIAVLALCATAHAVDANAVHRCELCGSDRCQACGPALAVVACAACGRGACGDCRSRGALCHECQHPRRVPTDDGPWDTGWHLGGGARLLVGSAHAVLVAGDGTRTDLVPDAHLAFPARARLRGLAYRFGLPPSAGLVFGAAIPSDPNLVAGSVWADVQRSTWWVSRPCSEGTVDAGLVDLLPEVSGPAVFGEHASGLAELLRHLRQAEEPPMPPAVVAMPFAAVRRVDIEDGEFVYRELWYDGVEPRQVASISQPLARSTHQPMPLCRPLARTTVGPVVVEVDGLHRSYVCRLSDGDRSTSLFVPATPEAQPAGEEELARLVASAGLPPDHVAVEHPRPAVPVEGLKYRPAAEGTEVRRSASPQMHLVRVQAVEALNAPILVGTVARAPAHARATRISNDSLHAKLTSLEHSVRPVAVASCLNVDEEWESRHGKAVRRYLISPAVPIDAAALAGRTLIDPDEPVLAVTDDGAPPGYTPVTVDSAGHLHAIEDRTTCPVCDTSYGPCCGSDGVITECGACNRPACSRCRVPTRIAEPSVACERCENYSCGHCSRRLAVRACGLCARAACTACMSGELCETCRSLAPASAADIAELPAELAAGQLAVILGRDATATVAVLAGANRLETVVIARTGVLRWETAVSEPHVRTAARIAVARIGGVSDVDMLVADGSLPPARPDMILLERQEDSRLLWLVEEAGKRLAGNCSDVAGRLTGSRPDDQLLTDLVNARAFGDAPIVVPATAPPDRAEMLRGVGRTMDTPSVAATLRISRQHIDHSLILDERGLVRRRRFGADATEEVAAWEPPTQIPEWVHVGWDPRPQILFVASASPATAVIATVGRHAMLGLRWSERPPVWWIINEHPEDLWRVALGHVLLHRPAVLTITAMTTRAALRGPTVVGAVPLTRRATQALHQQSGDAAHGSVSPATALAEAAPGTNPRCPAPVAALPQTLAAALWQRVRTQDLDLVHGSLGLDVQEEWRLPTGEPITVTYQVPVGQTDGHLRDAATGKALRTAHLCRSKHIAEALALCVSCLTPTCGACPDAVRRCAFCAAAVCGQCIASPDGRCTACTSLRQAGMMERRRVGVSRGDSAWVGSSTHIRVTVRQVNQQWSLERQDRGGVFRALPDGEWLRFLQKVINELG